MRLRSAWLAVLGLAVAACDAPTDPGVSDRPVQNATDYLETVLSIAEEHSIRRNLTDWAAVRRETWLRAEGAQDAEDTHAAVRFLLAALGDGHSAFLPNRDPVAARPESTVQARRVRGRVGLIELAGTFAGEGPGGAGRIQRAIAGVDGADVCGWIVDLRRNTGGDLWPQLAGLGPLLGEGVSGAFVDADGGSRRWVYRAGAAGLEGEDPIVRTYAYPLRFNRPHLAVLLGRETASSGEALATAFRGAPRARSFGAATRGLSTANRGFFLSDGSLLVLTVAGLEDRTGTGVQGPLRPDVPVLDGPGDPVLDRAVAWIGTHADCRLGR